MIFSFSSLKHRESKCDGLLCVRRLIRHHAVDVVPQLHVLILAVVSEVTIAFSAYNAVLSTYNVGGHYPLIAGLLHSIAVIEPISGCVCILCSGLMINNCYKLVKGTVHSQNKCPLCKSPSLAYLRMAIHSPQLSFVTEILDFVSLIFAHIIAAIFVELEGGGGLRVFLSAASWVSRLFVHKLDSSCFDRQQAWCNLMTNFHQAGNIQTCIKPVVFLAG